MYGGNSGCYGMVIYDTKKDGSNAVYGYYEGQQIVLKTGTREEMLQMKKEHQQNAERQNGKENKFVIILLAAMVLLAVLTFMMCSLRTFTAVVLFCGVSYFPLLVILFANVGLFREEQLRQSFCRFHGCEHAVVCILTKEKELSMEELKKAPIYDSECGTAYSGYIILLALEAALLIMLDPGFLKGIGIVALTVFLLFVNVFNPYNPFLIFQKPVVMPPTEREYQLGLSILNKMKEL